MTRNRKIYIGMRLLVALVVAIVAAAIYHSHSQPQKQASPQQSNLNTISDSSIGLTFNMSKSFDPIPRDELTALNPSFSYGFRPANDANTSCILTQTKLNSSGTITAEQLRDGIVNEVKSVHPDVTLDNPAAAAKWAQFGNGQGVLLQLSFTDGSAKMARVEIIALGKAKPVQVTAYCQSLVSDSVKYYTDFTTFFSSIKLT